MSNNNPIEAVFSLKSKLVSELWQLNTKRLPKYQAFAVNFLRLLSAVLRDLRDGQLNLRAMSLVYTTLLSLVPMLAISFSVLKGFGVHNQIEPTLLNLLDPLGDKRFEIVAKVLEFVDNIKVGVLGSVGLGLLIYTVVSLMQKIERAFNYTWHVTVGRSFAERFSDYLSVLLVGPLLIFLSIGMTAAVRNSPIIEEMMQMASFGGVIEILTKVIPYLLFTVAFAFIYIFMPNTKVRFVPALAGGLVSAFMWKLLGWTFATFVAGSAGYAAVYSAFATLILFMLWLYFGWLVILIGTSIAYYVQYPSNMMLPRGEIVMSNRVREKLVLMIITLIGRRFYDVENLEAWSMDGLANELKVPVRAVEKVVLALEDAGILIETHDNPVTFMPARPFDTVLVRDLLTYARRFNEVQNLPSARLKTEAPLQKMIDLSEEAYLSTYGDMTLKGLALDTLDSKKKAKILKKKK